MSEVSPIPPAIEGNTLSEPQVTELLDDGKCVHSPPRKIVECKSAIGPARWCGVHPPGERPRRSPVGVPAGTTSGAGAPQTAAVW